MDRFKVEAGSKTLFVTESVAIAKMAIREGHKVSRQIGGTFKPIMEVA